jgi:hypothetical protein
MAESRSTNLNTFLQLAVPFIFAIGGALLLIPPLTSSRPEVPNDRSVQHLGYQDVDAQLWQDPFAAAQAHVELHRTKSNPAAGVDQSEDKRELKVHDAGSLQNEIASRPGTSGPLRVLAVMASNAPDAEDAEDRLRMRRAVVEGLGSSDYDPIETESIGYVTVPWRWARLDDNQPPLTAPTDEESKMQLTVPFEWYRSKHELPATQRSDKSESTERSNVRPNSVLVLWLQEEAFADHPLSRLAYCLHAVGAVGKSGGNKISVRVIGPRTSDDLLSMVKECAKIPTYTEELRSSLSWGLSCVSIYSATATVDDDIILANAGIEGENKTVKSVIEDALRVTPKKAESLTFAGAIEHVQMVFAEFLNGNEGCHNKKVKEPSGDSLKDQPESVTSLRFERTIQPDGAVLAELLKELDERRHLKLRFDGEQLAVLKRLEVLADNAKHQDKTAYYVSEYEDKQTQLYKNLDLVALVCESDTLYGRSISYSYQKAVSGCTLATVSQFPDICTPWLVSYSYLRGLDGKAPGETGQTDPSLSKPDKTSAWRRDPPEPPDGTNQTDGLIQIAGHLSVLNELCVRARGRGIAAVGILGNDPYDKMMILKALRPKLSEAVFFTTDLDARLAYSPELKETHNLIIGSSYGYKLRPSIKSPYIVTPFRDSYQTSIYCATLQAIDGTARYLGNPRIFEIGLDGAYDLSVEDPTKPDTVHPIRDDTPQSSPYRDWLVAWLVVAIFDGMVIIWLLRDKKPNRPARLGKWLKIPWVIALLVSVLIGAHFLPGLVWNLTMDGWDLVKWVARGVAVVICLAIVSWFLLEHISVLRAYYKTGKPPVRKTFLGRKLSSWLFAVFLTLLCYVIAALLSNLEWEEGQPLTWLKGISIWPAIMMRGMAGILGLYFILKSGIDVEESNLRIRKEFGFELAKKIVRKRGLSESITAWGAWKVDPGRDYFNILWSEYLRHVSPSRFWRIIVASLIYYGLTILVISVWGFPRFPGRGQLTYYAFRIVTYYFTGPLVVILIFRMLDSMFINRRFIQYVSECGEIASDAWPKKTQDRLSQRGIDVSTSDDYEDEAIRLIAHRTDAVGRIAYYPLLLLFLLALSSNSYFGDWDWPIGIIVVCAGTTAIAILGPIILRCSAEGARSKALERLGIKLRYAKPAKSSSPAAPVGKGKPVPKRAPVRPKAPAAPPLDYRGLLTDMIARVEAERGGAFSLLSQYPFLAAIILPSGGFGVWVILEYFAKSS